MASPLTSTDAAPVPSAVRRLRRHTARWDRRYSPYVYILPFFLVFGVFQLFPILYTGYVSLFDWDIIGDHSWIGLDNYARLLGDSRFWLALRNTVSIWALSTFPQLAAALVLAHVLNDQRLRGRHLMRAGILIPNVTSVVAVAIIFESIFGLHYGIANATLRWVGVEPVNWQAGVWTSHLAIALMVMWRWTGYNAIIYLAGLQAIPKELYEAAAVDGASRWQQLRHITIPMLRPVVVFTLIISTIYGLQIFTEPLLFAPPSDITGGPARQYSTMTLFLYEQGFRRFKLGYAASVAWVLVIVIAGFVLANWYLTRRIRSAE